VLVPPVAASAPGRLPPGCPHGARQNSKEKTFAVKLMAVPTERAEVHLLEETEQQPVWCTQGKCSCRYVCPPWSCSTHSRLI